MNSTQQEINEVQKLREQALESLMARCRKSPLWDGRIRNGHVTNEQRHEMAIHTDDPEVQTQLVLQKRDGKFTAGLLS